MIFESQKELFQLLFAQVDFLACQKVLDFINPTAPEEFKRLLQENEGYKE